MKVKTEDDEQGSSHYTRAAAHKLEEVQGFAGGALHDGFYADEGNQGQDHFDYFENAEMGAKVDRVTPDAPQSVPLHDGLCGGLVRAASPHDH